MAAPSITLPFLSRYDPPGSGEGNLDPMGLYQISDQLAVALVPAVRERMNRIRFLTAITVGTTLVDGMREPDGYRDASPFLVWEWLVVQALIKSYGDDPELRGVPGSTVTARALRDQGYLDAAGYLKTPRIFGFHGIYKRLAIQLRLIDVNLGPGMDAGFLLDAWAKDRDYSSFKEAGPLTAPWVAALTRSLKATPPRANATWSVAEWKQLADAFHPDKVGRYERKVLTTLLLNNGDRQLGAFADLWALLPDIDEEESNEAVLAKLGERAPRWAPLLGAIEAYEGFARRLQDGFDALRTEAQQAGGTGFPIRLVEQSSPFKNAVSGLAEAFRKTSQKLATGGPEASACQVLFEERFGKFATLQSAEGFARLVLEHHDAVQRSKSAEGKRSWFDRSGVDVVHLRLPYRLADWEPRPDAYVHPYRVGPVARFMGDLV